MIDECRHFVFNFLRVNNLTINFFAEKQRGKISAQPHTIVKQICFPNGNLLFLSLFSLSKN